MNKEWRKLSLIAAVFLIVYNLPLEYFGFDNPFMEGFYLLKWYAREHVLLCLIPAFFIAGAISVFINQASVMKYLGVKANKILAYGVASVSGGILSVCSCTVLPLFAGIYSMGAGLGPATAFLYSGPAINILAIILTAGVLGLELGIARAVGAVLFAIIIGISMHLIFRKSESLKAQEQMVIPETETSRPLWKDFIYFASMVGILIFANWSSPGEVIGIWGAVYSSKWMITSLFAVILGMVLINWFKVEWWKLSLTSIAVVVLCFFFPQEPVIPFAAAVVGLSLITATGKGEMKEWFEQSWGFAKQILPLLFLGVFFAGIFWGRPGHEGMIPSNWIYNSVGENSVLATLFASVVGAFMYFATLTEIPILQGLIGNGMGKGPALALLLAGPALSLPNMLVIKSVIGTRKTVVFVMLVIIFSTIVGLIYGNL
ncbi:MAG: hypothetical protein GY855_16400 [candidate division Zixibacteria bacterium]|nr:hypothetical protein [candidate division Zixibacteria bacterium]